MSLKNGLTLDEALKLFRRKKTPTKKKLGKFPYHSIGEYYSLLDACFGHSGYIIEYSDGRAYSLASGQDMLMVKAAISILDCDGAVCYRMEGYGSYEPITESGGTSHLNLQNAGVIVNGYALKAACASAGAFGMRPCLPNEEAEGVMYVEEEAKPDASKTSKPVTQATQAKESKEPVLKSFSTRGELRLIDDRGVYSVDVVYEEGLAQVLLYKKYYEEDLKKFEQFKAACSKNKVNVSLYVYEVDDTKVKPPYKKAYVFHRFK